NVVARPNATVVSGVRTKVVRECILSFTFRARNVNENCPLLGPPAKEAVPVLLAVYQENGDKYRRKFAADALWQIDPRGASAAGVRLPHAERSLTINSVRQESRSARRSCSAAGAATAIRAGARSRGGRRCAARPCAGGPRGISLPRRGAVA